MSLDAEESDYLYIQPSQIPNAGNGLFTVVDIFKDEVISKFHGEVLTDEEVAIRVENEVDQYFIGMLDGRIMDSRNVHCFAKYANDAIAFPNSAFKNNSKITIDEHDTVCLIATRNIKAGSEIFCSYGKRYWKKHGQQFNTEAQLLSNSF